MSTEQEQTLAKENGWHRLGMKNVDVRIPLTNAEKLQHGERQSEALMQIQKLELEKKEFDGEINGQMKQLQNDAYESARALKLAHKIENRDLPCFLDHQTQERVYVDLETGEEMKREPMQNEDRQLLLGE